MRQLVLVVDDSGLNLRVAMNILKEHFEVACANSGMVAFDVIKKKIPDLDFLFSMFQAHFLFFLFY